MERCLKGVSLNDCMECEKYFTFHSLHNEEGRNGKTSTLSCSIGGDKRFDENGNIIAY